MVGAEPDRPAADRRRRGPYFWDYEGKRYLDFASQLVNVSIGHQHPKVVAAIKEQADKLTTIGPPMAHEMRSELARLIAEVTPGDLTMSFFTNGGAEANENAIKLARWYTGRHKVIARYRSYHGATGGAITLTGDPRRWPAEPGIPGVVRMLDPYTYRCPAGHPGPLPGLHGRAAPRGDPPVRGRAHRCRRDPRDDRRDERDHLPPDGYLQSIREVCDRHGIVLICDEVMAGFGRSGKWFACEHWNVVPDILTVAKGINSGYVPLGAMVVNRKLADWVQDKYFAGGLTYSGHVLACASAVASIEAFKEERIVENSASLGEYLAVELPRLAERHPSIGDVRGKGLFFGLELVEGSRDARAARPVQRRRRGGRTGAANGEGGDGTRALPLRALERRDRRAAAHDHPGGARRGPRGARRGALDRGRARGVTHPSAGSNFLAGPRVSCK